MSVTVRQLDPQCKPAEYVTLPQLETILPTQVIQEVLTDCEAWEQREKKLNMQAMIYLIIALALYPDCSTREVYRRLLEGLPEPLSLQQEVPTAGAFCQRRQQLGVTPLRELFARLARPVALPQTRAAFRFGLRVLATDGTLENLPDSDANRTVFPYHTQEELSRSPFPQARCVLLMECGTHVIFDAEITAVQQGELSSVLRLIERQLGPGMLLLCDAGICCSQVLFSARRKDAHVLGRLDSSSYRVPWLRLHDGSYLVKVYQDSSHHSPRVAQRAAKKERASVKMCLLTNGRKQKPWKSRRTHDQYRVFSGQHPGFCPVSALNACLVRRGDFDRSLPSMPGGACRNFRTGTLCPSPLRTGRGDRFSCRALRLCDQRRTDAGNLLRVSPALGRRVHGTFRTRPFASSFNP